MKCIVENRIGSLGSEYKRVDSEIRALENQITNGELALGRIQDADMAREATELARNNLRSDMATQVMSNSGRLKDVLIQLTTEHFRGAALSASLWFWFKSFITKQTYFIQNAINHPKFQVCYPATSTSLDQKS